MVIAALGTVFAAAYLLWLFQRTAFGEPKPEFSGGHGGHGHDAHGHGHDGDGHDDLHDVNTYEWIAWTPFLIAIVVFGVYPQLMFKIFDPAVSVALKAFGG
jgi:NADH-quinone oxidoreductase subunit M